MKQAIQMYEVSEDFLIDVFLMGTGLVDAGVVVGPFGSATHRVGNHIRELLCDSCNEESCMLRVEEMTNYDSTTFKYPSND